MGESAGNYVSVESRWAFWSHRLVLVCFGGGLILAAVLLLPFVLGVAFSASFFRAGFYAGLGVLAAWIPTNLKGVDVTLPEIKPPLSGLAPILLFMLIVLRYILLIETGLFGFLAFPSPWRYVALFAAVFGALGILKNLVGAMIALRAELRQLG